MIPPFRFQMSRAAGFRMPPHSKRVTRPGPWGNLFRIARRGYNWTVMAKTEDLGLTLSYELQARTMAVALFEALLLNDRNFLAEARRALGGYNLGCTCPVPDPGFADVCHGAVYLRLVNLPGA